MTPSKFIRKLFKRGDKRNAGASSTSTNTSTSPPQSPMMATILQASLPQKASQLLSLPGEIRNKIYEFTVYTSLSNISVHRTPQTVLSLPVFAICRQMRSEAISKLCSSKSFCLSDLRIANAFFEMIGDGVSHLRFVTICSETDWRNVSEEIAVEKRALLDHLKLATSLRSLHFVVGNFPLTSEDQRQLENASSAGARFLYAVRSTVDHERAEAEEELVMRERFLVLCDQIGALQAVRFSKEEVKMEHEERAYRVFRLGKVAGLEGKIESVMLPLRMPACPKNTEEDSI